MRGREGESGREREGVWVYELFQETKGEDLWDVLLSKNFLSEKIDHKGSVRKKVRTAE